MMRDVARERLDALYTASRPLVFGHRGAMAYAPMNTMSAFELAHQQGADGIEFDVWLTQDDVPVILHDFDLDKTTNGEGRVGSTPYSEIQTLDAGGWFGEQFAGEHVPTLDEVLETFGRRLILNIEIKSNSMESENIVWQVTERVRKHNLAERVLISCFNPFVVRQLRKAAPELPAGYLHTPDGSWWVSWFMLGTDYHAYHPEDAEVTAGLVKRAHQRNRKVNVWTVNDPAEAQRFAAWGVDALITNVPDTLLTALAEK